MTPRFFLTGALALVSASILAQTAPGTSGASATPPAALVPAPQTVVLSPFTVNTDRDNGFTAVNAGTATRLALEMRDVPAAYQVMTRDFIDALGITNVQEATQWATNGGSIPDGNGQDVFNITFLANMRGVALSGGQQRNNYLSSGTLDSYSLERYDFSRGPNAALFSIGGNTALGGGMGGQTKRARYDRAAESLAFTYGSWDYKRTTIDLNRPLTDRLAVRANAVIFDRGGWRIGEFEKTKGITVAAAYMITPKTELRVEGAYDHTKRNNPQVNLFDNVSGWDGRTVFRGPITNALWGNQSDTPGAANALGYALTWNGETQGVNRQGSPYHVYSPFSGQNVIMNYQNEGFTRRADETARTPMLWNGTVYTRALTAAGAAALPFGNAGSTTTLPAIITNTANGGELDLRYQAMLPDDRFNRALAGSAFRVPDKRFNNSLDTEILGQRTKDANFSLAHQVGDSLYLELGGDVNQVHDRRMNPNNLRNVRIDINQTLPNGTANSHFLQPYMDTPLVWNNRFTTNTSLRANVGWKHNYAKWGDYVLNLNTSLAKRNIRNRNYVYSMTSNPDPRMWQGADEQIRFRYYWNETSRPYTDSGVPASAYKFNWVDLNNPVASTVTVQPRWVLGDWNDQDEQFNNAILAGSAKYFGGKLVVLSSTRFDAYQTKQRSRMEFGDLPANWDGSTLYYKPDAPANWRALAYIPRDNTTGAALAAAAIPAATRPRVNTTIPANTSNNGVQVGVPAFANDRFRNDSSNPVNQGNGFRISDGFVYHALKWVSLTANYATSYVTPPVGAFTLTNDIVEPQTGSGYDTGLRFTLFNGRLTANTNYFYNVEEHQRIGAPTTGSINSLLSRNQANDATSGGRNTRGIPDVFGSDYQSAKNRGIELEIQGQLAKGLRMMINFGTGKVENYERFPLARGFVLENAAAYKQVLEDAGGLLDTTQKPSNAPHAPGLAVINPAVTPAVSAERTNAVNDYNNIWINYETILNDTPLRGTNRKTANVFLDYIVQTGRFKGVSFGLGGQYRGTNFLQYRTADTIVSQTNPNVAIDDANLGTNDGVYVKLPTIFTATAGYTLRLKSGARWQPNQIVFQLRLRNLTNNQQVVYQDAGLQARPPGGDITKPNRVSVPVRIGGYTEPISFLFTTTLRL